MKKNKGRKHRERQKQRHQQRFPPPPAPPALNPPAVPPAMPHPAAVPVPLWKMFPKDYSSVQIEEVDELGGLASCASCNHFSCTVLCNQLFRYFLLCIFLEVVAAHPQHWWQPLPSVWTLAPLILMSILQVSSLEMNF